MSPTRQRLLRLHKQQRLSLLLLSILFSLIIFTVSVSAKLIPPTNTRRNRLRKFTFETTTTAANRDNVFFSPQSIQTSLFNEKEIDNGSFGNGYSASNETLETILGSGNVVVKSQVLGSSPLELVWFRDSANIVVIESISKKVWRTEDEGRTWQIVPNLENVVILFEHPYDTNRGFALTESKQHFITTDQGKTWTSVSAPLPPGQPLRGTAPVVFNVKSPSSILYVGAKCDGMLCFNQWYYSQNDGATWTKLIDYAQQCLWTATKSSGTETSVACVGVEASSVNENEGLDSPDVLAGQERRRLLYSENFRDFTAKQWKGLSGGVLGMFQMQSFLTVAVQPSSSRDHLDFYVSTDGGKAFVESKLPSGEDIRTNSLTILDSPAHSLIISVVAMTSNQRSDPGWGMLYFSDSTGEFFTQSQSYTNRGLENGYADHELVNIAATFTGTSISNQVVNYEELKSIIDSGRSIRDSQKVLRTRISFNGGASWKYLGAPPGACSGDEPSADCALHLHSATEDRTFTLGPIFSSQSAPGVLMGVGSVGSNLLPWESCQTYLSDDGGATWRKVKDGPYKYEIADQGALIVMAKDGGLTDEILYSFDRGATWESEQVLVDNQRWVPIFMSSDMDGTGRNLVLVVRTSNGKFHLVSVSFEGASVPVCRQDDYEQWLPKIDGNACILGSRTTYIRRKSNVKCSINEKFKNPTFTSIKCPCTIIDFECDYNFKPDDTDPNTPLVCKIIDPKKSAPLNCDKTYQGTKGYRKIPGDRCEGGLALDQEKVERECPKGSSPLPNDQFQIQASLKEYNYGIAQYVHFERSSVVMAIVNRENTLWWSNDHGANWKQALSDKGKVLKMGLHEIDSSRAYFLLDNKEVWFTTDRLEGFMSNNNPEQSLQKLNTPIEFARLALIPVLDFHPTERDWLVFIGQSGCPDRCSTKAYITKNHGQDWTSIDTWVLKCAWTQEAKFQKEIPKDSVTCIGYADKNGNVGMDRLYGNSARTPVELAVFTGSSDSKSVLISKGVLSFYVASERMLVAVEEDTGLDLYVSMDAKSVQKAKFPPNVVVTKEGFTVLDSSTGPVFVSVLQSTSTRAGFGHLFMSDSSLSFQRVQDSLNSNEQGYVDFERNAHVNGTLFTNKVVNPDDVAAGSRKVLETLVNYNDGFKSSWKPVRGPSQDMDGNELPCAKTGCRLHLHSHTEFENPYDFDSSAYSSPSAAGIMFGVGNVGDSLKSYSDANTYLTVDAGQTWGQVAKGANLFAFADQGGLLVIVPHRTLTRSLKFSWDKGKTWIEREFTSTPMMVTSITTEPFGTSASVNIIGRFSGLDNWVSSSSELLVSSIKKDKVRLGKRNTISAADASSNIFVSVKFSITNSRDCADGDFESFAPLDNNGGPLCIRGSQVEFQRRKQDSICVTGASRQLTVGKKPCECRDVDYVCDTDYWRDDGNRCVLYMPDPERPQSCKPGDKYSGRSGYKRSSYTNCQNGLDLEKKVEKPCDEGTGGVPGEVAVSVTYFDRSMVEYSYFNQSTTILMLDADRNVWRSENEGKGWEKIYSDIVAIVMHPRVYSNGYLITTSKKFYSTTDSGKTFREFQFPIDPIDPVLASSKFDSNVIKFHGKRDDWLLFMGSSLCGTNCEFSQVFYSTSNGNSWNPLIKYVTDCFWTMGNEKMVRPDFAPDENGIACLNWNGFTGENQRSFNLRDNKLGLVYSDSFFKNQVMHFEKVLGAALVNGFIVTAVSTGASELRVYVSMDGKTFAEAQFPPEVTIPNTGFTVVDSRTGRVFMDMLISSSKGSEFGHVFISNWNGTFYSSSLKGVNRDSLGHVDFEKMEGMDGIAIANQVANPDNVARGASKRIRTLITHDDGSTWSYLAPPERDVNGRTYRCDDGCHLHMHHYTERTDPRNDFSSPSAPGILLGVGNVGNYLSDYTDGDTFLSRDAGKTWVEIHKDAHMVEFGNRGAILLLVNDEAPTDKITYSLDLGNSWHDYKFVDQPGMRVDVRSIGIEPTASSRRFVIWGIVTVSNNPDKYGKQVAIHLDFSTTTNKQCEFKSNDEMNSDFEAWTPEASKAGSCLFGRKSMYLRQKVGRVCYVDRNMNMLQSSENCACTVEDYECDFNFIRNGSQCILAPAAEAHWGSCENGRQYFSQGYRKIPMNTCVNGVQLDKGLITRSCGGMSGWAIFGIVMLCLGGVSVIGWGWLKYYKRGRIMLPVDDDIIISPRLNEPGVRGVVVNVGTVIYGVGREIVLGAFELGRSGVNIVTTWFQRRGGVYLPVSTDDLLAPPSSGYAGRNSLGFERSEEEEDERGVSEEHILGPNSPRGRVGSRSGGEENI